jgi:NADH-quinone oxidoreductase subunit N
MMLMNSLFSLDFYPILPEFFFFFAILILIVAGVFFEKLNTTSISLVITTVSSHSLLIVFLTTVLFLNQYSFDGSILFYHSFVSDNLSHFFKIFLAIVFFFYLLFVHSVYEKDKIYSFEFLILLLLSLLGYFLIISSYNFLIFYLTLELSSFCLYLLASFKRFSLFSTESGLKYFILGAFSSGLLLFGISLLYGCSGTINFSDLKLLYGSLNGLLPNIPYFEGLVFSIFLIFVGLFFKLAVAPFHIWAPDIYDGAPTVVTAYFAIVSKIAVFGVLFRFIYEIFPSFFSYFSSYLLLCALLSLLVGTLGALYQKRIKRLIAYSGIVHISYLILGLSTGTTAGVFSAFFYLIVYVFLNLNFFSVLLSVRKVSFASKLKNIEDLAVLFRSDPLGASNLTLNLFSMSGIPPLAGFFSKFYVLLALVQSHFIFSSVIVVLTSVVSAVYYLRLLKIMFFEKPFKWSFFYHVTYNSALVSVLLLLFNLFLFLFQGLFFSFLFFYF